MWVNSVCGAHVEQCWIGGATTFSNKDIEKVGVWGGAHVEQCRIGGATIFSNKDMEKFGVWGGGE